MKVSGPPLAEGKLIVQQFVSIISPGFLVHMHLTGKTSVTEGLRRGLAILLWKGRAQNRRGCTRFGIVVADDVVTDEYHC